MNKFHILSIIFLTTICTSFPLVFSMELNSNEIKENIQTRIEQGGNLNTAHDIGIIPLIFATQQNDVNLIQQLVQHHADVNVQDVDGSTPISWAIRTRNVNLANFFIDYGAWKDVQDDQGQTPLSLAQEYSLIDVIDRFQSRSRIMSQDKEQYKKKISTNPYRNTPFKYT